MLVLTTVNLGGIELLRHQSVVIVILRSYTFSGVLMRFGGGLQPVRKMIQIRFGNVNG